MCSKNHKVCENIPGTYFCKCATGYKAEVGKIDLECIDINECSDKSHKCSEDADCDNTGKLTLLVASFESYSKTVLILVPVDEVSLVTVGNVMTSMSVRRVVLKKHIV